MIIGMSGLKGSGKSTAASFLEGKGFKKMSFAEPIKRMLACIGLTDEDLYGSKKESFNAILDCKTPRYAMQTLGTQWGRDLISSNIWRNIVRNDILQGECNKVVIEDCRFPNEVEMIMDLNGYIIYIDRGGEAENHASESQIKSLHKDYAIENFGTVHDLSVILSDIIDEIKHRKEVS